MTLKLTTLVSAIALAATSAIAVEGTVVAKASDSITINGDLRLRHESRKRDFSGGGDDSRNRLRTRFRLGLSFKTEYGWSVAAGLASGGSDGTSTNATWSNESGGDRVWATGDIRLDYAYVQHAFETGTKLTGGQQKNPFKGAGIFWDGDLRPTGFTVQQSSGILFATAGYYNMGYTGDSAMAEMLGAQVGVSGKERDVSYTAGLSYYVANDQLAHEAFGAATDYSYEFINVYADASMKLGDSASVKVFAEAGQNVGADDVDTQLGGAAPVGYEADENNAHYTFGVESKFAKKFKAKVQYAVVEGDSVFGGWDYNADGDIEGLSNSDFGSGAGTDDLNSDIRGFIIGLGYSITKNCSIGLTYMSYERIERTDREVELTQIDLKYKF